MHWSDKYLGRPYVVGSSDCATLVKDVLSEVFNKNIQLPQDRGMTNISFQKSLLRNKELLTYEVDTPIEGDTVLMKGAGRINHIGLYCNIRGVEYVLHNMQSARQVVRHKLSHIHTIGHEKVGFYRWK